LAATLALTGRPDSGEQNFVALSKAIFCGLKEDAHARTAATVIPQPPHHSQSGKIQSEVSRLSAIGSVEED